MWEYFIGEDEEDEKSGLFGRLFSERAYNKELMSPEDTGFILTMNKLVGGVLLVQYRAKKVPCTTNKYR